MGEMVKVFFNEIKNLDGLAYINNYLRYQLSPLILGVKPAVTININKNKPIGDYWDMYGEQVVDELGLKYTVLREGESAKIVIVYDEKLIEEVMKMKEVRVFLTALGYQSFKAEDSITYLAQRYSLYHCPHELGVFLGIPLHDVEAFMSCQSGNCLLCGYWKVYSNLDYAVNQFKKYDAAKELMLKKLIKEMKSA